MKKSSFVHFIQIRSQALLIISGFCDKRSKVSQKLYF